MGVSYQGTWAQTVLVASHAKCEIKPAQLCIREVKWKMKRNQITTNRRVWNIKERCGGFSESMWWHISKGNKIVQIYAFRDRGSSAMIRIDWFKHQLYIRGKGTNILLCTMGQEKTAAILSLPHRGLPPEDHAYHQTKHPKPKWSI